MNLKDMLRKGDPAADDPGLSPEEVQAMRRTVLNAVPEPRRRGWLVPVLATAALILAAVLGLSLWRQPAPVKPAHVEAARPEPSPPQPPSPTSPPPSLGEGGAHGKTAVASGSAAAPLSPGGGRRGGRGVGGEGPKKAVRPRPEPTVAIAQSEAQPQQIQFSTPGGTRVIWLLHPAAD
jgi:hypothetical protein